MLLHTFHYCVLMRKVSRCGRIVTGQSVPVLCFQGQKQMNIVFVETIGFNMSSRLLIKFSIGTEEKRFFKNKKVLHYPLLFVLFCFYVIDQLYKFLCCSVML